MYFCNFTNSIINTFYFYFFTKEKLAEIRELFDRNRIEILGFKRNEGDGHLCIWKN